MAINQNALIQTLQDSVAVTNRLSSLLLQELQQEASGDVAKKSAQTLNVKKAEQELIVDEEMFAAIVQKGRPEILKLAKKLEIDFKRTDKTDTLIALISEHLGFELEEAEEEEEEEAEEAEEEEVEADEDEEGEEVDLSEMDHKELISFIEENFEGVEIPKKKKSVKVAEYADQLRAFIEEELLGEEAEEEEEEEEEEEAEVVAAPAKKTPAKKKAPTKKTLIVSYEDEDGEEVEEDLLAMTEKELRAFAADFDITLPKKKNVEALAELLHEAFQEDAEEEPEEEEEEEVVAPPAKKAAKAPAKKSTKALEEEFGLDELDLEELAEILAENGLSTSGKRPALVARIVEGIEDGTIEVDEE